MNLIIDRGNTRTKIYFFKYNECVRQFVFMNEEDEAIKKCITSSSFEKGIISSSADIPAYCQHQNILVLNYKTPMPIQLNYDSLATLGTDRIALAAGAQSVYPNKPALIISAGTCITIDFVDEDAVYQGGIISPGINMRFDAMNDYTASLPHIEFELGHFPLLGKTTHQSMQSGVINSVLKEVDGIIDELKSNYQDLTVLITGGDYKLFELQLKNKIFVQPLLQAFGLNSILEYNYA